MFMLSKLSVEDLKFRITELETSNSNNSEMIYICNLLSEKLRYNNVDLTCSLSYANKAKNLSIKLNYKEGQAYSLAQIGYTLFHLDKFEEAEENLRSSINLFDELDNKRGLAFALNGLIWVLIDFGKFTEATDKIQQVFDTAMELGDDKEKINVFDNISKLCFFLENYDLPLEFNNEIISLKKSHLNYGRFYNHIGLLYFIKGDNEKSLENFDKAIFESQLNKDTYAIAKIYSDFANVYYSLEDNEKAIKHFEKSNSLMKEIGLDHTQIAALQTVIKANLKMEDYPNALKFINKSLNLIQDNGGNYLQLKNELDKAFVKNKLGEIDKALSILLDVAQKLDKLDYNDLQSKCQYMLTKIYEGKKDTVKALEHFHLYDKYNSDFLEEKSSIFHVLSSIKIKLSEIKNIEKTVKQKNVEIAQIYDELASQNEEIHQTNTYNDELVSRVKRLKKLLPVCNSCNEMLNQPNYLDEIEAVFSKSSNFGKNLFSCLGCYPSSKHIAQETENTKVNYATR